MSDKVVVIDRDPAVRDLVSEAISYGRLFCTVAGYAENVQDGAKLIEQIHPQIIITDLHLAGADAFEMLDACKNVTDDAVVMILSQETSFDSAQKAIERQIFRYVLKPVNLEQMSVLLKKMQEEVQKRDIQAVSDEQNKRFQRRCAMTRLLLGQSPDIRLDSQDAGLKRGVTMTLFGMQADGKLPTGEEVCQVLKSAHYPLDTVIIPSENRLWVVTMIENQQMESGTYGQRVWLEEMLLRITDHMNTQVCFYSENGLIDDVRQLPIIYREAKQQLNYLSYAGLMHRPAVVEARDFQNDLNNFVTLLNSHPDQNSIKTEVSYILEGLGAASGWNLDRAKRLLYETAVTIMENTHVRITHQEIGDIITAGSVETVRRIFLDVLSTAGDVEVKGLSLLVTSVVDYIQKYYAEDITLTKVAEKFFISPNHLGKQFKSGTGQTFTHFLNSTRIRRAKQLLRDPAIRINEIANMVGYCDYAYFYQVFKKYEGISPAVYRNGGNGE